MNRNDTPPKSLDARVVQLWRGASMLRVLVLAAGAFIYEGAVASPVPQGLLTVLVLGLGLAHVIGWPGLRYRAWSYRVRDEDLQLRHGVLWRTESIVPHARIQHVDLRRGPLDRWIGLAQLVVFTAGSRGAMLTIPGLDAAEAERLRDRLIALSGVGDAV